MKTCSVEGCGRPFRAKGLCITHYTRQRKGTPLDAPITVMGRVGCAVEGCDSPHHCKGFCAYHYKAMRKGLAFGASTPLTVCSVAGCGRRTTNGTLCAVHRWRELKRGARCTVPGCDRRSDDKSVDNPTDIWELGLCRLHRQRRDLGVPRERLGIDDQFCAIEGCRRLRAVKGLCARHHRQRLLGQQEATP